MDLWDPDWHEDQEPHRIASRPHVNITFANADAGPVLQSLSPTYCQTTTELECRDNEMAYMYYYNLAAIAGPNTRITGMTRAFCTRSARPAPPRRVMSRSVALPLDHGALASQQTISLG